MSNKELAKEVNKPIIRKFKERKVHSFFIDDILGDWSCRYANNKSIW